MQIGTMVFAVTMFAQRFAAFAFKVQRRGVEEH
jgi:hypothetical protein